MAQRVTALARAAASEDRLKLLRELRARVVEALDQSQCARDVEPLARRLAAISGEIDELASQREPSRSPADVIAARREERRRRGEAVPLDHSEARRTRVHG
ncbi:hypothetical protein [Mycobacterium sp. E735]|uniref:hypothetical protein n=1 Tax=Mycobacterium sp. E735 TaxID=1834148 RepID=UPI000B176226|nr:hypothetical protein [Mycobacterium sp. E735]